MSHPTSSSASGALRPGADHAPTLPGTTRLHGLDALRALALGLGIVLHTLAPFLPGTTWMEVSPWFSGTAATTVTVIHLFRMGLFMLLAGYFGRMVATRRGTGAYLRDRSVRVLAVLVVLSPFVLLSLRGVDCTADLLRGDSCTWRPLPDPQWLWLFSNPAHLWFLWVLVQVIALFLLVRGLLSALAGSSRAARWGAAAGRALTTTAGGGVLAAVPTYGSLLLQRTARQGVHQPPDLLPDVVPLLAYGGAFTVGWLLHAHPRALRALAGRWRAHLLVAAVLSTAVVVLENVPWTGAGFHALLAPLVAVAGWCWTYGLLGLFSGPFTQVYPQGSPTVRYLADSAYWVYVAHLPLTAVVQLVLAETGWYPPVQLLSAWAVSAVLLLVSYDLLVRGTWFGAFLNGRHRPPVLTARLRGSTSA